MPARLKIGLLYILAPLAVLEAQELTTMCHSPGEVVATARVDASTASSFALNERCGATGGNAIARGLESLRSEKDTLVLSRFMAYADVWRDARVMHTAMEIAESDSSSVPARIFAIRHLLTILNPHRRYQYAGMVRGIDSSSSTPDLVIYRPSCRPAYVSEARQVNGENLPADHAARIRAILQRLRADTTVPNPIRNAALCA